MFLPDKAPGEVALPSRENLLDEAAKLLLKAAAILEDEGFCKLVRYNEHGEHCVLGALDKAAGYSMWGADWTTDEGKSQPFRDAVSRLAASIGRSGWDNYRTAALWNNASERTKAEVVAKLRSVALGGER